MSETYTVTPMQVLRGARRIVEDGGDPSPCEFGKYCLRCCLALAKGAEDERVGFELSFSELDYFDQHHWSDVPLRDARDAVAKYDKGIAHTRESALELLDRVIQEYEEVK